jgi:hypothetical protein
MGRWKAMGGWIGGWSQLHYMLRSLAGKGQREAGALKHRPLSDLSPGAVLRGSAWYKAGAIVMEGLSLSG